MRTVGIIGAGVMGRKMIELFIKNGDKLLVYDKSETARRLLSDWDLTLSDSISSLSSGSDVIILSLPGPVQVEEVMTGVGGILSDPPVGKIVIDTTTSNPETSERMYALSREKVFSFMDAPILGRPTNAGSWLFPVGGNETDFPEAEGYLTIPGKKAVYIPGGAGSGHKLKLLNQLLFTVTNTVTCEMMAIVEKSGLEPEVVYNAISQSGAATVSGLFCEVAGKIVNNDWDPLFPIDLLRKDSGLGIGMAKSLGASPLIAELSQTMNNLASDKGFGAEDTSALVKIYRSLYTKDGS